jgi:hypothetical protein
MNRRRFLALTAAVSAVALLSTPAFAKPSFAGNWKLVADKSDYGPMPVPDKFEQAIEEKEADIKVSITSVGQQGEFKGEFTYNTEGKETTNELRGNPMKSKAKYDGEALVIETKLDFQGNEIQMNDKWTLEDEGKTMVIHRKLNTPQGELEQKIVLSKQ